MAACATVPAPSTHPTTAADEVRNTELGFAKTMADRNLSAFKTYLSPDAIFFSGTKVEHGAAEISASWAPLYRDPTPPFSWAPDRVEVLPSGDLALSTGPVTVDGKVVGRFNSVWRLAAPHTWRIVFDKGESVCER